MTVRELIEELSKCSDKDKEIFFDVNGYEVFSVSLNAYNQEEEDSEEIFYEEDYWYNI